MSYDPLRPDQLYDRPLITYRDAVEHLLNWNGSAVDPVTRQMARRACDEALRELGSLHRWSFYYTHGRVATNAQYTTGTVGYDHTGGSAERIVTLASGTWPDWAAHGTLRLDNVPYPVASRISSTVIQLEEGNNPGADVASGASYKLYREYYPLPSLWKTILSQLVEINSARVIGFVDPKIWLNDQRWSRSPSQPFGFTIMGNRRLHGGDAIFFSPPPDTARSYDMVYLRAARPLVTEEYSTGTASCSSSVATSTLTGSGTSFSARHKGAVVRLSGTVGTPPTSRYGSNPAAQERIVTSVESATSLTVDAAFDQTLSGTKYAISDPIDVDLEVMLNLFLRTAELRLASLLHRTDLGQIQAQQAAETIAALAADNRWSATRVAGLLQVIGWTESVLHTGTLGNSIP